MPRCGSFAYLVDDVQIPKINKVVKGRVVKGQIGYGINLEEML
jgi:hypothetical protein